MKTIIFLIIAALFALGVVASVYGWEPTHGFISYIQEVEGYSAKPYRCAGGYMTIGYGHRITAQDALGMTLTRQEATMVLVKDLKAAYGRTGGKYDGVKAEIAVDFYFNGCPRSKFPKFFAALDRGDYATMRKEYKRYSKGRELTGRNRAFKERFL